MLDGNLTRPWDAFDAYLFDIDGTLIHCTDAVHYFAFCDALSAVAGRPMNLDGVTAHGNTDIGILRDAFTRAGVADAVWRPQLPRICEQMSQQVERNSAQLCVTVLPAVRDVLLRLRAKGAKVGVATGNLERIGIQKLKAASIWELFDFAGWSNDRETRADVFERALTIARSSAGADSEILVIGDTPADVRAAKAHQLPVIAVATGVYGFAELAAERPDWCIHSMTELLSTR